MADFSPAFAHANVDKRMPTSGEIEDGFGCGPLSLPLFNGLTNAFYAELGALLLKSSITPSNSDMEQVARAVRSQRMNYATAGGTANAITVALDPPAASLAEIEGLPIRVKTGVAANTTGVTINIDGLGVLNVRGSDNQPLPASVLPATTVFEGYYNGSWFQLISILPSSAAKAPAAFVMTTTSGQSVAASTQTVVNWFSPVFNDTLDSTLAANQVTIGAKDAGWWAIVGKLIYDFPASGVMYTNIIIERNGSEISAGNAPGTGSIRARPQATGIYKLSAGDIIRMSTATDMARNLTISGGSSIFAGFKIGA